jgi:hypothetical protein
MALLITHGLDWMFSSDFLDPLFTYDNLRNSQIYNLILGIAITLKARLLNFPSLSISRTAQKSKNEN